MGFPVLFFVRTVTLRCLVLLIVGLCAGASSAWASDIRAERSLSALDISDGVEVLVDPGARMTLADVLARPQAFAHRAHGEALNFGYTDAAVWLRLHVSAAADAPRDWRLVIGYPTLDRVDFFYPSGADYLQLASGDHLPYSQRAVPHRDLVFPLSLTPGQTSTVYLRLQSQGTLTVPMQILQRDAFERDSEFQYAALGVYYGALLILVFFGGLMYLALREPVFINYVGYILFFVVGTASLYGLVAETCVGEYPRLLDLMPALGFSVSLVFVTRFVADHVQSQGLRNPLQWLLALARWLALLAIVLAFAAGFRAAIYMLSLATLLTIGAIAGISYLSAKADVPHDRLFTLAALVVLAAVLVFLGRNQGWIRPTLFSDNVLQIAAAVDMVIGFVSFAMRASHLKFERNESQRQALQAREMTLETLRRSEQQLEQQVRERTLALSEANLLLQEREQQVRAMALRDNLTGLSNRIVLMNELNQALARMRRAGETARFAVLMLDLDGFKAVNDSLGHAAGDQVLIEVARRIRSLLRETDTAVRLGGDEFVVLLEAVGQLSDAQALAQALINDLQRPVVLDAATQCQVGTSIGITLSEPDDTDAKLLLRADKAMYLAKAGGRGCHRSLSALDADG